jgi:hypothetical protein
MRTLGESSNPYADQLFRILKHLRETERLEVRVVPTGKQLRRSRSGSP